MSGHFRKKALGFVLLMGAGILLGMQLAGSGLRSVYGPEWNGGNTIQSVNQQKVGYEQTIIEDTPAANTRAYSGTYSTSGEVKVEPKTEAGINEAGGREENEEQTQLGASRWYSTTAQHVNTQGLETPRELLAVKGQQASVDTMADKTAGLLQNLSRQGIRWVVSVFDGVTE
ncbi:hypothetical protein MKY98_17185 [Paenibacillus sp. FSL M8-0228]|jgi:hypothetical protein|uniref:Uncharacterized protein n=1 Tax=Paenibacillus polymyxa TaxID=1406 RepID=A0A8I1IY84_PAEPO|nr:MULTISPECIES: hypothetical protein [Paenibacillus]KAF6572276.1 hypothetical protein G9G53_15880 [Paenibacillus sp. EKM206P]KAF6586687.1 hypothetical protein G9G52_18885 [Paenibacillus sp. EKM205P]MBM0634925.1 hypothetical protein [Paenibacillus polymyxa]MBO3286335.1 hypothetical protein [Paenibacillus polymyxa]MDY8092909.1 hypothetical protein [Paenibacillus polymyxa]